MAKIGSSQTPPPSGKGRLGGTGAGSGGMGGGRLPGADAPADGPPPSPRPAVDTTSTTLAQRLENATRAGALPAVPAAYDDGPDWETILQDDVFAKLYLSAPLYAQISDAQVATNQKVLAAFWERKSNLLITGNRELEEYYRPGTINNAQAQLVAAATALADAAGRKACFEVLEGRRLTASGQQFTGYLEPLLESPMLTPTMLKRAVAAGIKGGFTQREAEKYLLQSLGQARYAPIKQQPNLLEVEWTPNGVPPINRPSILVMGKDVYSLPEAGQVLYDALASSTEHDKAQRNLDSEEYLRKVADVLRETDAVEDIKEIFRDKKLSQSQRRLTALYLFGPGLPFYLDGVVPAFESSQALLTRAATSAKDYGVAEASYSAGLLPIWLRAAGTTEVKAALPAPVKGQSAALAFRQFLHKAAPTFPLWIAEESFTSLAQLAHYIRRDERSWEMVYGSLTSGYLGPWLHTLGRGELLNEQARRFDALLGSGLEPASPQGRHLAVQALLEALDPQAPTPTLKTDLAGIDLTGLSGETLAERTLALINSTGGPVRVLLHLEPVLEGVQLSHSELFFDQRAPGQRHAITLTGSPALMPRDGQHQGRLHIRTVYAVSELPIVTEAVFPQKEFWQFVGGAALALALALGSIRFVIGLLLGESAYRHFLARGELLPLDYAEAAGRGPGFIFIFGLLLLVGIFYFFVKILKNLATGGRIRVVHQRHSRKGTAKVPPTA